MFQWGSSYPLPFVSSLLHCIFWLISLALFVLSHNIEQQTTGTNISSHHKWSDGCEWQNCLIVAVGLFLLHAIDLLACLWSASILPCILSCSYAYSSMFISHSLIVAFSIDCFLVVALLQRHNDQSPSTKSPSQAPTASPITPDPTKVSNVTIPFSMIQRGSSYPRRLWTLVFSCFSCIFWLLSVPLFVLSHYVSIYISIHLSIYTTTTNKHQAPTSSPTTSDPTIVSS